MQMNLHANIVRIYICTCAQTYMAVFRLYAVLEACIAVKQKWIMEYKSLDSGVNAFSPEGQQLGIIKPRL